MFSNWRDCQEYRALGLPLSTTSNEACKLYDATVTQFVSFCNDPSMGGIKKTMMGMLSADPNFVMGHVLKNGMILFGSGRSVVKDAGFKGQIDAMLTLANSAPITRREQLHVEAVKLWAEGDNKAACFKWEEILLENPLDIVAIKSAYGMYLYRGRNPELRDLIARCLPYWKETMPLYGNLLGMYALALEENGLYRQAETAGRKALEMNPNDGWTTHALVHVMEMEGRAQEGSEFLGSTFNNWTKSDVIACHNFWHWALYYIELNDFKSALDLFDSEVIVRCQNAPGLLVLTDACALLYRLEMEGVDVGNRWNDVLELCKPHTEAHTFAFNDAHFIMACVRGDDNDASQKMMESMKQFVRDGSGYNHKTTKEVGLPLCEAIVAYEDGDYGKAVELLFPVRYDVINIGGSHAQRDIFNLFLIHAAMKSPVKEHHKLARNLLIERKAVQENSQLTDRLMAKAMAMHMD